MKKCTLIILLLFTYAAIKAQDYKISFAGKGASTTVGTAKVENLTQGKSMSLLGSEVLHLVSTSTGINPILDSEDAIQIYPNPANGNSKIDFVATNTGKASVELFDITGKRIAIIQITLTIGTHSYQIDNLRSGIYTVRIYSQTYSYTGKLVSNGISGSEVKISYVGIGVFPDKPKKLKNASTEKLMQFNNGDRLKITGTTGIYSTIKTITPTKSITLTFPFVDCTDKDGNHYPVVQIGTQIWMAENLKVTSGIYVTDSKNWQTNYEDPSYCWYANYIANRTIYGALYNRNAVKFLLGTEANWHIPSIDEWNILFNYVGNDANMLKETGSTHWKSSKGTNVVGFTAVPGGGRSIHFSGSFEEIGTASYWWTSSSAYFGIFDSYNPGWSANDDRGLSARWVMDAPKEYAVTDIDGNKYTSQVLGTQEWLVEDLKTTKLNDGTIIPNIGDKTEWQYLTSPGYCWYDNNGGNKNNHGALYNWYTVNTGKLCPKGWHVPSEAEWITLKKYLVSKNTRVWIGPIAYATNENDFIVPSHGGYRSTAPVGFFLIDSYSYWWSSTQYDTDIAIKIFLNENRNLETRGAYKISGLSVRCIKD